MADEPRQKSFMPMYWGDFLADTSDLSCEELGMYIRLISHYWNTGPLTTDHKRLARVCNTTKHKFEKNWQIISRFFSSESGKYFQKRIDKEIAKAIEISEKRAEAGRLGGQANASANAKQMQKHPQPHIKIKEAPVGALDEKQQKLEFWNTGLPLLTEQGMKEKQARTFLGKIVATIGFPDALEILRLAKHSGDAASYLAKAGFSIKLPTDNRELWELRVKLGLPMEYDNQADCHEEIRQLLRAKPELRERLAA